MLSLRLKITLDLPPIEPRPPIPPRIYKRLYTHLDNILPNNADRRRSSSRVHTPNAKSSGLEGSPASQSRPLPSRGTPTKAQSLAQFRSKNGTPTTNKTPARNGDSNDTNREGLRLWVAPVIRHICTQTDNKKIAATVVAGVETIVGGRRAEDSWVSEHITETLAVILHAVFVQAKALSYTPGEEERQDLVVPTRKEILELLGRVRSEVVFIGMEEDGAWDGFSKVRVKDFDEAAKYALEQDWFESDWFRSIDDIINPANIDDAGLGEAEDTDMIGMVPGRRVDSMFQDKYDFLSESRRADYKTWKEAQLQRISQLMANTGAMEIDAQ